MFELKPIEKQLIAARLGYLIQKEYAAKRRVTKLIKWWLSEIEELQLGPIMEPGKFTADSSS
jgi:hypothetical protein